MISRSRRTKRGRREIQVAEHHGGVDGEVQEDAGEVGEGVSEVADVAGAFECVEFGVRRATRRFEAQGRRHVLAWGWLYLKRGLRQEARLSM